MEYHSRVRRCFVIQTTATSYLLQPDTSRLRKSERHYSGYSKNGTPIRTGQNDYLGGLAVFDPRIWSGALTGMNARKAQQRHRVSAPIIAIGPRIAFSYFVR